jgi:choline dehydrogenase-like flavoprotein
MPSNQHFDIAIVGAGVGGVSAALGAARTGARTVLIERQDRIGGTGINSPVGLICTFCDAAGNPINRGVYQEYVPYIYKPGAHRYCQTYDEHELLERYEALIAAETNLTVMTSTPFTGVEIEGRRIKYLETAAGKISAEVFIDSTAEGHLAAACGAPFQIGRDQDNRVQPATLTFRVNGVDFSQFGLDTTDPTWRSWPKIEDMWEQMKPLYQGLKQRNGTSNPREEVLCFPDHTGTSLLFNQTCIRDMDPTKPESIEQAYKEGLKQVHEFWSAVSKHPAFANSAPIQISKQVGFREGRRIIGDHILTADECLSEARFDDMIAACGYFVDVHDPETGLAELVRIPGSGYYHIPYRSLCAKTFDNLLLGSRCISGSHEAHGSYRVMSSVSAIGQAAGVAAALAAQHGDGDVRQVQPAWIRYYLEKQNQFIEGNVMAPTGKQDTMATPAL